MRNERREISFLVLMGDSPRAAVSIGVGKSDVSAERDHAEAGSNALAAAKTGAGFKFAFERGGEQDHEEVGGGIETDGKSAEKKELKKDVTAAGHDELRNERKEKERGFGIEDFGENALTKGMVSGLSGTDDQLRIAGADHADAEPNEISGTGVLDGMKRDGGSGEDRGNAQSGGEDVEKSTNKGSERRKDALAAAAGEAASEHVEDARARSDGEKQGGGKEKVKAMRVNHGEIVRSGAGSGKAKRTRRGPLRAIEGPGGQG